MTIIDSIVMLLHNYSQHNADDGVEGKLEKVMQRASLPMIIIHYPYYEFHFVYLYFLPDIVQV